MERLRADVRRATGRTVHYVAGREDSTIRVAPLPTWVEIRQEDAGVFLLRHTADSVCVADTWHESIDAAKRQAHLEYEIDETEWHRIA
jgi:hypothetical protein